MKIKAEQRALIIDRMSRRILAMSDIGDPEIAKEIARKWFRY